MIPDAPSVLRCLTGAARLARLDADALALFDDDARAFVQSFFAALLVAPGYAVLVGYHVANTEMTAGTPAIVIVEALGYVISWTAFPVLAHDLTRLMDRSERWMGFVVALNWAKVIQMAVYLPLALLAHSSVLGESTGGGVLAAGMLVVLVYQWFVTRTALNVHGVQAAGLTGFDVVLGFLITSATDSALMG